MRLNIFNDVEIGNRLQNQNFRTPSSGSKIIQIQIRTTAHNPYFKPVHAVDFFGTVQDAVELAGLAERQPGLHNLQRIDNRRGDGTCKAAGQETLVNKQVTILVTLQ